MPHATYQETPIRIDSPQGTAWGVVCAPAHGMQSAHLGVVFVSGGFQYRAGSHRQTVQLARHLATAGVASLRFDLAGLGDATGTVHSFEQLHPQLTAAIGALTQHATALQGIVLWGLCDGASAALLYCEHTRDARIAGLALVNPWVRSEASLARTHVQHYYLRRLQDKAFWQKLLRGGVGLKAVSELLGNLHMAQQNSPAAPASFQERMAKAWREFNGRILLVISEDDITGQEFMQAARQDANWAGCLQHPGLTLVSLPDADHTCATPAADKTLTDALIAWTKSMIKYKT